MTLTEKPSCVINYGAEPFTRSTFRYTDHAETRRMLASPHLFSGILLDVGRMLTKERPSEPTRPTEGSESWRTYKFDWMDWYVRRKALRESLLEVIGGFIAKGQHVTAYVGGIHHDNAPLWYQHARDGNLEREVRERVKLFEPFRDSPLFSIGIDGSGADSDPRKGPSGEQRIRLMHTLTILGMGYGVVLEGTPGEGHPLWGHESICFDVSTSQISSYERTPNPEKQHIWASKLALLLENLERWRKQGKKIYIGTDRLGRKPEDDIMRWWDSPSPAAA